MNTANFGEMIVSISILITVLLILPVILAVFLKVAVFIHNTCAGGAKSDYGIEEGTFGGFYKLSLLVLVISVGIYFCIFLFFNKEINPLFKDTDIRRLNQYSEISKFFFPLTLSPIFYINLKKYLDTSTAQTLVVVSCFYLEWMAILFFVIFGGTMLTLLTRR